MRFSVSKFFSNFFSPCNTFFLTPSSSSELTCYWASVPVTSISVQLLIEDASRKLRSGDLGIPPNPEDRSEDISIHKKLNNDNIPSKLYFLKYAFIIEN